MSSERERIDTLLINRGIATDIRVSRGIIMQGIVLVDDNVIDKAGALVKLDSDIRLKKDITFVSRGAIKLSAAVDEFNIDFNNQVVMDIGSSTGGFTEIALLNGAKRVYAIDVGVNIIHEKLRSDSRVTLLEGINFRLMDFDQIGRKVDIIIADLSFISLKMIIPNLIQFCSDRSIFIPLIKPQFEASKDEVCTGGIVTDHNVRVRVIEEIVKFATRYNLYLENILTSPIKGRKGNIEYLALFIYNKENINCSYNNLIDKIR